MKRARKARLYRIASAGSVRAAELRVRERAADAQVRARLDALGAKLELQPSREVLLGIHVDLPRTAQQPGRYPDVADRQPVGIRGERPAHLREGRRASRGAAALENARHVDVVDRAFLDDEVAHDLV